VILAHCHFDVPSGADGKNRREIYASSGLSDGIAVSVETLTHVTGLLDWATTFNGSQLSQQLILILSNGPWRDDNLLTTAESFFQTNAYHPFATCIRGHMNPVHVSRTEAAPGVGKETGAHRSIAHVYPHEGCNGQDPQHFRSNENTVRDIMFLEEAGIFSYKTIGREEKSGHISGI